MSTILDSVAEDVAVVLLAEVLLKTGGVEVVVELEELEDRNGGGEDELDGSSADEDVGDGLGV